MDLFDLSTHLAAAAIGAAAFGWVQYTRRGKVTPALSVTATTPDTTTAGAAAILDVDDLAGLNSSKGLDIGDRLLNAIELTLRRSLPDGLTLERLEQGRFLIWIPTDNLDQASRWIDALRSAASRTYVDGADGPVSRTLSAGLVPTFSTAGRQRTLIHADATVARAKALGGNRLSVNQSAPVAPATIDSAELEAAYMAGELGYHVQPIIDLTTSLPAGVEALLRWFKPNDDMLGPEHFLERIEQMPDLQTDIFVEMATNTATPFMELDPGLFCSFNISGALMDGENGVGWRWLTNLLDLLPPDRLVVEVVEHAVLSNPARARLMLETLRARGVRVALDDFGVGLSNLDRLLDLPVDFLKIDRRFTSDLTPGSKEEKVLKGIICFAGDLGIELIAEGIEDEDKLQSLKALGVRYGQGYFLGRPDLPATWRDTFASTLADGRQQGV